MKQGTSKPHPGPFRTMKVDAEFAGILVAAGFFVMGFLSVPIAKGFLIGAALVGVAVAVVLGVIRKARNSKRIDTHVLPIEDEPSPKP